MPRTHRLPAVLAFAIAVSTGSVGDAAGRFNLPVNVGQYLGYGNGAGHHAPLVLGTPIVNSRPRYRVKRVLHSPAAPRWSHGFTAEVSSIAAPAPRTMSTMSVSPSYSPTPAMTYPAASYPSAPSPSPRLEPASPSDVPRPEAIPLPR